MCTPSSSAIPVFQCDNQAKQMVLLMRDLAWEKQTKQLTEKLVGSSFRGKRAKKGIRKSVECMMNVLLWEKANTYVLNSKWELFREMIISSDEQILRDC